MKPQKQILKLFLLGILSMLLFNFPLVSLSGSTELVWGFPRQYIYVFGVWIILLVMVMIISRDRPANKNKEQKDE